MENVSGLPDFNFSDFMFLCPVLYLLLLECMMTIPIFDFVGETLSQDINFDVVIILMIK